MKNARKGEKDETQCEKEIQGRILQGEGNRRSRHEAESTNMESMLKEGSRERCSGGKTVIEFQQIAERGLNRSG